MVILWPAVAANLPPKTAPSRAGARRSGTSARTASRTASGGRTVLYPAASQGGRWSGDAPGKHVRWRTFCEHDKDTVRPYLATLIGPCMPGGSRREPIRHDDLIALALADIPPKTKELRMLRLAGMSTAEALDKLGVRPDHRARVIGGRTGGAPKRARSRRS